MTARDIIADIDAILRGDISGPEQVRGVLKEAREEIKRLRGELHSSRTMLIALCAMIEERHENDLVWTNAIEALKKRIAKLDAALSPTPENPTHG